MSLNNLSSEKYSEQQMKLLETMTVQMDGRWLKGSIDGYEFFALVFQNSSKYGINEGRISKLAVRYKLESLTEVSRYIINYDRGWDIEPATEEHRMILDTLIEFLENLPNDAIKEGC